MPRMQPPLACLIDSPDSVFPARSWIEPTKIDSEPKAQLGQATELVSSSASSSIVRAR
jgi:hypothetical protein